MRCSRSVFVRRTGWAALGLLVPLLTVAGCGTVPPPTTTPQVGGPLQTVSAKELVSLMQTRADATRSAKGLFQAKIKGPGLLLPARIDGTVFYQRPDAMRVRGFSFFGGELFELVLNGDRYRLALPTERREMRGSVSELGQVEKFGRPVQLSLWAVYGALGLTTVAPQDRVTLTQDGDRYRLDAVGAPGSSLDGVARRLWFDRSNLLLVQEEWLGANGQVEATMRYEDFRPVAPPPEAASLEKDSDPDVDADTIDVAGAGEGSAEGAVHPIANAVSASMPQASQTGTAATAQTATAATARTDAPVLGVYRPFRIVMEDGRGRGTVQLTMQELSSNMPIDPAELGRL
ncbi:MAG: hypothetical protein U0172_04685 [Nitrospiraceae bacterium]